MATDPSGDPAPKDGIGTPGRRPPPQHKGPVLVNYAVIFRTHLWDDGIAEMARRAAACCPSAHFVVAADVTNGPLNVEPFQAIPHTCDAASLSLPNVPPDRTLWWNADYVLYFVRERLPGFDYYVMLEYDVLLNCDIDSIIARCMGEGIDFVAKEIGEIHPGHWSRPSALEMTGVIHWALIPLVVVSARAVDALYRRRRAMAYQLAQKAITQWPYCEPFMTTVLAQHADMKLASWETLLNAQLLRYRPILSLRDKRLAVGPLVAHPVFASRRFIETFLREKPSGSHLMPDGRLWPDLANEDPAQIRAVLGEDADDMTGVSGLRPDAASGAPRDVARNKPATQSSHSAWSRAPSAAEDARRAVSGILPADFAFHTQGEPEPWWRVDLLTDHVIAAVEIINRPGKEYRFKRFRIESSLDDATWTIELVKADQSEISSDEKHPALFTMPTLFRARYVKIVSLGSEVLHLRRVRVFGVPATTAAAPQPTPAESLAQALADPAGRQTFLAAVQSAVHDHILGRNFDSYNIDAVGFLGAAIEANRYALANMAKAQRFATAEQLHAHAAAQAPERGMVLEFGVYSGRTINHLAACLPTRTIYGFDSFEGLPETWRPGFEQGKFRTDMPLVRDNVELVVGWFDRTLPDFVAAHPDEPVALLHVDCDLYSSTRTIFSLLGDRISAGTIIVFDEYFNYPEWTQHEHKAFREFVASRRIEYDYIGFVPNHQQVAVRILRAG